MQETEGVIKYHLHHNPALANLEWDIAPINTWRTLLFQLQLIGQQANRYMGYGYGNISQRMTGEKFIISGTQTGGIAELSAQHYCLVNKATLNDNSLYSTGPCQPSSEALTHASVYAQDPAIHCVIHVHSPEIWRSTQALGLAHTEQGIAYGTPEMAHAVGKLFASRQLDPLPLFTMPGHEDGVIAFGQNFPAAAFAMINTLASAKQLEFNS